MATESPDTERLQRPDDAGPTQEVLPPNIVSSRLMKWLVTAGALAALAFSAWQVIVHATPQASAPDDAAGQGSGGCGAAATGPESVHWTADGRYLVIQTHTDEGGSRVVVWDAADESTRAIDGMRVAAVESAAPVIWLVPESGSDVGSGASKPSADSAVGDIYDSPPDRLLAWDLAQRDGVPTDDVPAKWAADSGPGDWVAYYEVDPLKGSNPSRLLFNNQASHGEGHKAQLPEDVMTFVPRGWSASGRYLALEELAQAPSSAETTDAAASLDPQAVEDTPKRRLMIVDAASGQVVSMAYLGVESGEGAGWDPEQDALLWAVADGATTAESGVRLLALRPGGEAEEASDALGFASPNEWQSAWRSWIAGSASDGLVCMMDVGDRVDAWRVASTGAMMVGTLPWHESSSFAEAAPGIAAFVIEMDYETGTETPQVLLFGTNGERPLEIWRGGRRQIPGG